MIDMKNIAGKKVLITGGLGFIGSNLAKKCLELGAKVEIFENSLDKKKNVWDLEDKIDIIIGDIRNEGDVEMAIKNKDLIFHLAAQTSHILSMEDPKLDIDINLLGTLNILESCRKLNPGARIVSVGTVSQLGIAKELPIDESMKDDPIEIYSANKLICEKYFKIYHKSHGLFTSFLRLGTIYGERQQLDNTRVGITNFFIGKIMNNEPITIYGDGKFRRDYIYVDDVVDALIVSGLDDRANGESFLIGGDKMDFVDMVCKTQNSMEKMTGKKTEVKFVEFPEDEKKIDVGDTEISIEKIKNVLGWTPKYDFESGIEKTIRYYQDNNKFGDYL